MEWAALAGAQPLRPRLPAHTSVQLCSGEPIADVAARVTPSVVNVFSERKVQRPRSSPFFSDPSGATSFMTLNRGQGDG